MPAATTDPTTYRFQDARPWWAARYVGLVVVFGPPLALLGYAWVYQPWGLPAYCGVGLAVAALLALLRRLLLAAPAYLTLGPDQVQLADGTTTQLVRYADLRGFRELRYDDGSAATYLEPLRAGADSLSFGSSFPAYAHRRELLAARVPDLDAGAAPTPPAPPAPPAAPTPATVVAGWVNRLCYLSIGLALPIWPYEPAALAMLVVPLVAAWALWRYSAQLRLSSSAPDGQVLGMRLVTAALFGFIGTFGRFDYAHFRPLWLPLAVATAGWWLALLARRLPTPD